MIRRLGGLGATAWRVSLARKMARQSGMDQNEATAVTLLSDDGVDAAYLAASLRGSSSGSADTPAPRDAADRLRELQRLRDEGLVTAEEYEARRRAIVDSL